MPSNPQSESNAGWRQTCSCKLRKRKRKAGNSEPNIHIGICCCRSRCSCVAGRWMSFRAHGLHSPVSYVWRKQREYMEMKETAVQNVSTTHRASRMKGPYYAFPFAVVICCRACTVSGLQREFLSHTQSAFWRAWKHVTGGTKYLYIN